jgi:hypothetical protein
MARRGRVSKNSVEALARRERLERVKRLRLAGCSFQEIATQCDISSTAAQRLWDRAVAGFAEPGDRRRMRAIANEQIRGIILTASSLMANAEPGVKYKGAKLMLSALARQARMFGLDSPTRVRLGLDDDSTGQISLEAARMFIGQGAHQDPQAFVRQLMRDYRVAETESIIAEAETVATPAEPQPSTAIPMPEPQPPKPEPAAIPSAPEAPSELPKPDESGQWTLKDLDRFRG